MSRQKQKFIILSESVLGFKWACSVLRIIGNLKTEMGYTRVLSWLWLLILQFYGFWLGRSKVSYVNTSWLLHIRWRTVGFSLWWIFGISRLQCLLSPQIPDKEVLLILAYFGPRNTIVADFPFCLSVVVDSKFGICGMYWTWMRKHPILSNSCGLPPASLFSGRADG